MESKIRHLFCWQKSIFLSLAMTAKRAVNFWSRSCFSSVIYIKTLKVQSSDYSKIQFLIQNLFSFIYFLFIAIKYKTSINNCEFLEYWNTQKSIWRIRQHCSYLSTWWGDSKNMKEIEFAQWLFEGRLRQGKYVLPDGLNWLCFFTGSSKGHRENSISFIILESPNQVDMKNAVKSSKYFFGYFNTLETHSV